MTAIDLEGLRALLERATPGPWRAGPRSFLGTGVLSENMDIDKHGPLIACWGGEAIGADQADDNAKFIAAFKNAAPALLAELSALRSAAQPAAEPVAYRWRWNHTQWFYDEKVPVPALREAEVQTLGVIAAPPAAAVERAPHGDAGGGEPERCPHCGYTAEDKARWLDHDRCPGRRALDGEKR